MLIDRRAVRAAEEFSRFPQDMLLNTRQVAELLGVSMSFLEERRVDGEGPRVTRLGRACRYAVRDIKLWLQSRAQVHSDAGKAGRRVMTEAKRQVQRRRIGGA